MAVGEGWCRRNPGAQVFLTWEQGGAVKNDLPRRCCPKRTFGKGGSFRYEIKATGNNPETKGFCGGLVSAYS